MKWIHPICLASALLAPGCVKPEPRPAPPSITFEAKDVSLVIAKRFTRDLGPTGISDRQPFEGKIFAFATFHWDDPAEPAGEQVLEFRWFSGDRWVSSYRSVHQVKAAPFYAWTSTYVTNIGPGKGRVELHYRGNRIASRDFEILEPRRNPAPGWPLP